MKVKVFRIDPQEDDNGHFQEFDVPVNKEEKWTIMDVLFYITGNLDSSLAYYRHSICNQGVCARCSIKVNGKPVLACAYPVIDEEELILEPRGTNIVRDLVIFA